MTVALLLLFFRHTDELINMYRLGLIKINKTKKTFHESIVNYIVSIAIIAMCVANGCWLTLSFYFSTSILFIVIYRAFEKKFTS
jgi:hypothetical protein